MINQPIMAFFTVTVPGVPWPRLQDPWRPWSQQRLSPPRDPGRYSAGRTVPQLAATTHVTDADVSMPTLRVLANGQQYLWWKKFSHLWLRISAKGTLRNGFTSLLCWCIKMILLTWVSISTKLHIDGLVQERCNSIANALELRLSCTNPSICAALEINHELLTKFDYFNCWPFTLHMTDYINSLTPRRSGYDKWKMQYSIMLC